MAIRANPRLIEELALYGAQDVNQCYHCGNCSAACPFSKEPFLFPRRSMRYLQMGLEEKLVGDLEPWLCYYCGECSEQCPREAEPGETMMSMRRWLTSRYDFTGISRLFYRSWKVELAAILLIALLTGAGFLVFGFTAGGGDLHVYAGENAFLTTQAVHTFDWVLGGVLGALLGVNCLRMWWFSIGRDKRLKIPLFSYVKHAFLLPIHFFTQKRYAECEAKRPWAIHLVLMLSYTTMLVLIMFFLHSMHAEQTVWVAHAFGYLATIGLLGTAAFAIHGRIRKTEAHYRHTHETDWMFLLLLVFVAGTGILQSVLYRLFHLDAAANITYVIHMMGVVPMLGLEVPFSKWAHLAYRPLAMYFSELQAEAIAAEAGARDVAAQAQVA